MQRTEEYKTELLSSGFALAYDRLFISGDNLYFWKTVADKTAFAVNLKVLDCGIGVVCGYFSTATYWDEAGWDFLKRNGQYDDDINLREIYFIGNDSDGVEVRNAVKEMYEKYRDYSKDEILDVVRNKRKEFMARITAILKPLGFRKKGNLWSKTVNGGYKTEFHIDKSPYGDTYEFDIFLMHEDEEGNKRKKYFFMKTKRSEVLDTKWSASHWYDWQLEPFEFTEEIVNKYLDEFYYPLCKDPEGLFQDKFSK